MPGTDRPGRSDGRRRWRVAGPAYLWARRPRPLKSLLRFAVREAPSLREGLLANLAASAGSLVAGIALGAITGTLERLPGLLVLVPAAIGMRGNIFGALANRFGSYGHAGVLRLTLRRGSLARHNLYAVTVLTFVVSAALAVLAKVMSEIFGEGAIGILEFMVISVVGGVVSSLFVGAITLLITRLAVTRGWDLDNVGAPLVTAAGDMVTLPALFMATFLVDVRYVTVTVGITSAVVGFAALLTGLVRSRDTARRIIYESLPVLMMAATIDVIAGLTIEARLESFTALQALLVLVPSFFEGAGALGGILSARLTSKLHTGLLEPRAFPTAALPDVAVIYVLAGPVFFFGGISAALVSAFLGFSSPGYVSMVQVSLLGGLFATTGACVVAYYAAMASYRLGFDPDNHGIPMVTSSMDLIGAFSLIGAILILGLA